MKKILKLILLLTLFSSCGTNVFNSKQYPMTIINAESDYLNKYKYTIENRYAFNMIFYSDSIWKPGDTLIIIKYHKP